MIVSADRVDHVLETGARHGPVPIAERAPDSTELVAYYLDHMIGAVEPAHIVAIDKINRAGLAGADDQMRIWPGLIWQHQVAT
jgi:hypothetical protein